MHRFHGRIQGRGPTRHAHFVPPRPPPQSQDPPLFHCLPPLVAEALESASGPLQAGRQAGKSIHTQTQTHTNANVHTHTLQRNSVHIHMRV